MFKMSMNFLVPFAANATHAKVAQKVGYSKGPF